MSKKIELTEEILEKLQESLNERFKGNNNNGKKEKRRKRKPKNKEAESN